MMQTLGSSASVRDFATLERCTLTSLYRIQRLIEHGQCTPWAIVKHSPDQPSPVPTSRMIRLGVFPIAANPLHWAHLLCGLLAIESFGLDKVIYVIAGTDPRKPSLASAEIRHRIARSVLRLFHPLFEYSSIAREAAAGGEENLFRILGMNPLQRIHAFYIAGSDHCHRADPVSGRPDTIQKLEDGIARSLRLPGHSLHSVTAVFLDRGDLGERVETTVDVRWAPGPPLRTSSTMIRSALPHPSEWDKLFTLPFGAFTSIQENHLYDVHTGEPCSYLPC
jgi:nicotinic acid mononucleotide adenylyltransferase